MGIGTVDINLATGSILVHYNPKLTNVEEISRLLENRGFFDRSKAATNDQYLKGKASIVLARLPRIPCGCE